MSLKRLPHNSFVKHSADIKIINITITLSKRFSFLNIRTNRSMTESFGNEKHAGLTGCSGYNTSTKSWSSRDSY